MKINIIGPSGSGKTTLSKLVAKRLGIKCFNLDSKFIDLRRSNKKRFVFLEEEKINRNIDECVAGENWVIEGIYPVEKVLEAADIIVFIRPILIVSLVGIWLRFLTSPYQRKKFGLVSYLNLSGVVLKQYLSRGDYFTVGKRTYKYPTLANTKKILYSKYGEKVLQIKHGSCFEKESSKDTKLMSESWKNRGKISS